MHKMGSPWPWSAGQQEVKPPVNSSIPSIHHNNNNNKRTNNGYGNGYGGGGGGGQYANNAAAFYNYQQNQQNYNQGQNGHHHHHSLPPQQDQNQHQHQNMPPYHHPHNRFIPTSPPSSAPVPMEVGGSEEIIQQRNKRPPQQIYFTFEGMQNNNNGHHHHPSHHNHRNQFSPVRKLSLSTTSHASASSPTITTTTGPIPNPLSSHNSSNQQPSQFVNCVKGIPTWNRYYSDQKGRIIDFTDKNNPIRPEPLINQLVSLCFVDTCITNLAVDAIVNSTTEDYAGIAGVDKMIHQQAGSNLREACKSLPRLAPGQVEMTLGFELPAKYVIHTNGPLKPLTEDETSEQYTEQLTGCSKLLELSIMNSFNLLLMYRLRTIAFPCISTGRKGLPKKFAAEIALRTVRRFLEEHKHSVDRVIFCLHHQKDIEIYLRYMQIYFPVEPPFTTVMIT